MMVSKRCAKCFSGDGEVNGLSGNNIEDDNLEDCNIFYCVKCAEILEEYRDIKIRNLTHEVNNKILSEESNICSLFNIFSRSNYEKEKSIIADKIKTLRDLNYIKLYCLRDFELKEDEGEDSYLSSIGDYTPYGIYS